MKPDAYTKAVLTVIAGCLLWLCVMNTGRALSAQQPMQLGGTTVQPSQGPDGESPIIETKAGAATKSIAAGKTTSGGGHAHQVTATIQSVNPTGGLLANSAHDTGPALNGLPRHKQILLIQKS